MTATIEVPKALWDEINAVLELTRTPALPDPDYHEEVMALGERIGFGALMSATEAAWRETLESEYGHSGGEFTCGTCRVTLDNLFTRLDEFHFHHSTV